MCRRAICLVSFVAALIMAPSVSAGLVGHWKFDEGTGTTILDSSGNENHGTVFDNVQWSQGKFDLALQLFGSNGHGEIPFSESLKILNQGDFTIAAWMLVNTVPPPANKLLLQQTDLNGTGRSFLFVAADAEIRTFAGGAATGSGFYVKAGEWVHAAVVVNELGATDRIQIYVNGQPSGPANTSLGMESCEGTYHLGSHKNVANNVWDGLIDDLRIYNHALTEDEIATVMEGSTAGYPFAYRPTPADGALHADTWVNLTWSPGDFAASHDVYLGDNLEDVTGGAAETFRGRQVTASLLVGFAGSPYPDGLVPGTTYYWRVDEVNETDPNSPWKGSVWSFSIPPRTAYYPDPADGAQSVALDAKLSWTPGYGAKLHTVYFGDNFDDVNNASGGTLLSTTTYSPGPLQSEKVYYWRVDETDPPSMYKGQVWSFTTLGAVGNANPSNGAPSTAMNTILSWTPSDHAASHQVYFGMDKEAVRKATTTSPEYQGTRALGAESYDPGLLAWDSAFYWRIDEVNNANAASPWKGPLWNFTTGDFLVVDDIESYNDLPETDPGSNRIYLAWIDGFGTTTNGAFVGNLDVPLTERANVHSGSQAMPLSYDNNLKFSEATLTLSGSARDWTRQGVTDLSLWFRGQSANAAEQMYVALNSTAVVYNDDTSLTQKTGWTEWVIPLQQFASQGVNLTNVTSITIGFGTRGNTTTVGGTGQMYFDDIRLYR